MKSGHLPVDSLLAFVQKAVIRHDTNPYQIAKQTGIALRSVQNLLKQESNPTLSNLDLIVTGLGYSLFATMTGEPKIMASRRTFKKSTLKAH